MWVQIDDNLITDDLLCTLHAVDLGFLADRLEHYRTLEADERTPAFRQGAQLEWSSAGEIEIDADAVVSYGDDPGAYVMAWVWVTYAEAGLPDDQEA